MNKRKQLETTIEQCIDKAEGVLPEIVPILRAALAALPWVDGRKTVRQKHKAKKR
jgi:hypothetical protein